MLAGSPDRRVTTSTGGKSRCSSWSRFAPLADALARRADEIASQLADEEATVVAAANVRRRPDVDPDLDAAITATENTALARIATLSNDWHVVCFATAVVIQQDVVHLRRVHDDAAALADEDAVSPAEYAAKVAWFSVVTGTPIAEIDSTGKAQEAADDWVALLGTTGIGEMYFAVTETTIGDDPNRTLTGDDLVFNGAQPEIVRAKLQQWGQDNGIAFDDATLDVMTAQVCAGALLMSASANEDWRDIDDEQEERDEDAAGQARVLAYVAGVPPVTAAFLMQVEGSATTTAAWWRALDGGARQTVIDARPAGFGNTDGVPATVRDEVNRADMADRKAELEEKERDGELSDAEARELDNIRTVEDNLAEHEEFRDPYTGAHPPVQLYVYEPAAFDGDGRVAIALGDLDTAEHVAVAVPGFSSSVTGMAPGGVENIYREARWASDDSDTVAVVDWMGYDTPNPGVGEGQYIDGDGIPPAEMADSIIDIVEQMADGAGVLEDTMARDGAEVLAADVAGINAMRGGADDVHLTVIGNSYGSTTSAIAADEFGLEADELVLTGSPGAGDAESADNLSTGADHTWVASSSSDGVTYVGSSTSPDVIEIVGGSPLGIDPADEAFGAQRMQAQSVDQGTPLNVPAEHGRYTDPNSESLYNIAAVVAGEGDEVLPADGRHQEPLFETHDSGISIGLESCGIIRLPCLDIDTDFDAPIEVNAWPTEPESEREATRSTHNPDGLPPEAE